MPRNPLYAACVRRAALLLGGYEALSARLGIPAQVLERWAAGSGWMSESVFLRIVDILLKEQPQGSAPPSTGGEAPEVRKPA
jgi:hypothetical protein